MIEIRRGKSEEFVEILDFLDFVFSKNSRPHNFETMYPNIYRNSDEYMHNLLNLWEDGKIKASILILPRTLSVGGRELKVYGIGSVACHPRERGRGFMSMLLKQHNDEMRRDGVHMSNLGGRRSRYNHFGFEIGGNNYNFSASLDSIKLTRPDIDGEEFFFKELSADETELISELKKIYESKPVHYVYDNTDDFYLRMVIPDDNAVPYAVYCACSPDTPIGFAAVEPGDSSDEIRELCIKNDSMMSDVLLNYAVTFGKGIELCAGEWQLPFFRGVTDIGSAVSHNNSGMWEVVDWQAVISALLSFKGSYSYIEPGTLVLDIEGTGKLAVTVSNSGEVDVQKTDAAADVVLPGLTATRALLGAVPQAVFGFDLSPRTAALVRSWFPLPLSWFSTERV